MLFLFPQLEWLMFLYPKCVIFIILFLDLLKVRIELAGKKLLTKLKDLWYKCQGLDPSRVFLKGLFLKFKKIFTFLGALRTECCHHVTKDMSSRCHICKKENTQT